MERDIRVVELFAGVGGFRLGLENCSPLFKTVLANQWEPFKTAQYAYDCYKKKFKELHNCINDDVAKIKDNIPSHDLLVGGFPCQDYSVAKSNAQGIQGKKGVLWWEILDIVKKNKPRYILLENVDRLLKSPSSQRGRDFGVMLKSLADFGYGVEWRVINAAEYGFAQRRRRVFIFAFRNDTNFFKLIENTLPEKVIGEKGFFADEFPIEKDFFLKQKELNHYGTINTEKLEDFSRHFKFYFENTGFVINHQFYTAETKPISTAPTPLLDVLEKREIEKEFFLNGSLQEWEFLKGSKKIERTRPNGEKYFFTEGKMSFPDSLELPARTMLTSESRVNRSSHVVTDWLTGKLRLLTPVECERINGFPDNWTKESMPEKFRYFVMGNALVVPLITKMGRTLLKLVECDSL